MDITGVDFITLPTRDFDRASAFYGDVLGLECSTRWGNMPAAEFETGTLTIAVMQSDAFEIEFARHSHPVALHSRQVGPCDTFAAFESTPQALQAARALC